MRSAIHARLERPFGAELRRSPATADYTLALRMQVRGRSAAERRLLACRQALWRLTLRNRQIWQCALRWALPANAIQFSIALGTRSWTHTTLWTDLAGPLAIAAVTLAVGLLSAAGTEVNAQLCELASRSN